MKKDKMKFSENFDFFFFEKSNDNILIPGGEAMAGFPAPAESDVERIDIVKYLVPNPESTFYARVKGNSMSEDFREGDLLIIDRSEEWTTNRIALCFVNGEFTLKRIKRDGKKCFLMPSNQEMEPIEVSEDEILVLWGIVTHSVREH